MRLAWRAVAVSHVCMLHAEVQSEFCSSGVAALVRSSPVIVWSTDDKHCSCKKSFCYDCQSAYFWHTRRSKRMVRRSRM